VDMASTLKKKLRLARLDLFFFIRGGWQVIHPYFLKKRKDRRRSVCGWFFWSKPHFRQFSCWMESSCLVKGNSLVE
jgi:hypothetical protein